MSEMMHDHEAAVLAEDATHDVAAAHVGWRVQAMLARVLGNPEVSAAVTKARAAGVPWTQIIAAILPLVLSIFTGGGVNIQAIIQAILALFNPPAPPTPAPAA